MENILEVYNLNKTYTNFSLSNISFVLPEDCITGFIGVNGAGKTTTIRSILDVVKRDSGKIKIFGKDFDGNEKELKIELELYLMIHISMRSCQCQK